MTDAVIQYRDGCKYQLQQTYRVQTPFKGMAFKRRWSSLDDNGVMTLREGLAWNGASGPTIDSPPSIHPSGEHDELYGAIETGDLFDGFNWTKRKVEAFRIRRRIDLFFCRRLIECGMAKWRANAWLWGVRKFGASHAVPGKKQEVHTAPAGKSVIEILPAAA